jgi:hypothetical protein
MEEDEDEVIALSWADAANFTYAITAAVMAGESLPKFPPGGAHPI